MIGRRSRAFVAAAVLAAAVAVTGVPSTPGRALAQGGATLRVDPTSVSANAGTSFTIQLVQNAGVDTAGTQADLVFDPKVLRVSDIKAGPSYRRGLYLFGSAADGSPSSTAAAVAQANKAGTVSYVATGAVPAGDAVVLAVTLEALPGPSTTTALDLQVPQMLDQGGNVLPVTTTAGSVTVRGSAPASGGPSTSGPSGAVSPGAGASGGPGQTAPPGSAIVQVAPESPQVAVGASVTVDLQLSIRAPVSSAAATLTFDQNLLQIVKIEPGPAWKAASLQAGPAGATVDTAVAQANTTGALTLARVLLPVQAPDLPSGSGAFITVTLKGIANGTSSLALSGVQVLDSQGRVELVSASDGQLVVGTGVGAGGVVNGGSGGGSGGGVDPVVIVGALLALVLIAGAVLLMVSRRRRGRTGAGLRRWPFVVALVLGLIPVVMFVALAVMLVVNSLPVLRDPGLAGLLGDRFSSKFSGANLGQFGLLPALSGTVLITAIALLIGLPASMALALVATEFPMGPVGRVVRPLVGILSGIPPIVFAVSVPIFITAFMIPKFAANTTFAAFKPASIGANPATWPPPDVPFSAGSFPWDLTGVNNSTLLGGVLIAALLIPFMTPLITDAIRNVPSAAREASLALGANRGYTLRKVILPIAMPAIAGAVALGTLKALGDTLIVAFAVGWEADAIPNPIVDVLERTPSLAAQGAGMLGSFETLDSQCLPRECAVGYSTSVLLLLVAAAVVLLVTWLQARTRARVAA